MADRITQTLVDARDGFADTREQVTAAIDRAAAAISTALKQAEETAGKLVPDKVTGTIQNYRFGKFKNEMHPSGNADTPVHVFECDLGNQVLLHIVLGSDRWDAFVSTLDDQTVEQLESGSNIGELLQGKRITLQRDTSYGRFVPTTLAAEEDQEPIAKDRAGQPIYKGTTVNLISEGLTMEVVLVDSQGYLEGRRSDGTEGTGKMDDTTGLRLYQTNTANVEVASQV